MKRSRPAVLSLAAALLAATNLVFGLGGGLARLGTLPAAAAGPTGASAIALHGALMVCGFFGTLIALERAVALHRGFAVPLLAGAGGVAGFVFGEPAIAGVAWLAAGLGFVALYVHAGLTRAWSLHLVVEGLGALCLALGSAAWLAGLRDASIMGWAAFLVLTIAGERRELTQMVRLPAWARRAFVAVVVLLLAALAVSWVDAAGRAALLPWWTGCAALALWLLRFDLAPRAWREPGWRGHTAQALSVGYAWLLAAALAGLAEQRLDGVALHFLLLGFVFGMVFGHAPIILPALARIRPEYHALARWPLWIMAASLVLRAAGLWGGPSGALALAGAGHALAIAWFAAVMARGAWRGRVAQSRAKPAA